MNRNLTLLALLCGLMVLWGVLEGAVLEGCVIAGFLFALGSYVIHRTQINLCLSMRKYRGSSF